MRAVVKIVCVLLVALCISPGATAEQGKDRGKDDPPTELWKAFPLRPQPAKPKPTTVPAKVPPKRPVSPPSSERPASPARADKTGVPMWFLVTVIGAAGAALALAVFLVRARTALVGDVAPPPSRDRRHEPSAGADPTLTRVATYGNTRADPRPERPSEERPRSHEVAGRIEAAEAIERRLHEAGPQVGATFDLRPVPRIRASDRVGVERCSISVWQGFERSRFVALPVDGARRDWIAESPVFRVSGVDVPERTAGARQALAEILGELERQGWAVVGEGPEWFDRLLDRPLDGSS
jgi:hypothetical protein